MTLVTKLILIAPVAADWQSFVPINQEVWDHIFASDTTWGMKTIKIDHLYEAFWGHGAPPYAGGHPEHTAAGEPIWDDGLVAKSENKTEVLEAVKLCALANASLSINYSPWAYIWGSSPFYCPTGPTNCDPTIGGVGEEL